ncbi:TnsA-like heteromeric transposase endonuclease subunit [Streptomyces sp. NPDC003273]|uniref:TnsA-like heteromeric transposase endonuclease subunit n=1 Tax=Streptomyces sp. NPDC003273 TaxID=3364678 RepID=UPI0036C02B57
MSARPLGDCATARFDDAVPVRPFRWPTGGRHFPGWYWSATSGQHIGFESWLERDHLVLMDFDPAVVQIASQPFWLHAAGSTRSGSIERCSRDRRVQARRSRTRWRPSTPSFPPAWSAAV